MDLELAGQLAVVVGGASGIGRAIAAAFAAERASVVLLDVQSAVREAAETLTDEHRNRVSGYQVDATDYEAMRRAAAQVLAEHDNCRHLVYAAGAGSGKFGFPFWKLEPSDWQRVLQVNLLGAVNTAHAFVPQLVQSGEGSMLLISSIAGQIGSQTDPPYSAAKAGLINFAQCAAKDLAAHHVRVNTICPGMVRTPLNQSVWQAWYDEQPEGERQSYEQWAGEKVRRVTPLGRWQTCEDVAAMAVFLASARAANVTGQTMNVDGGQVMHW